MALAGIFNKLTNPKIFYQEYTMKYYIKKGADPKKLIMGIPLYAQSFTLIDQSNTGLDSKASGPGQAGEFTRAAGFTAFYEVRITGIYKQKYPNFLIFQTGLPLGQTTAMDSGQGPKRRHWSICLQRKPMDGV